MLLLLLLTATATATATATTTNPIILSGLEYFFNYLFIFLLIPVEYFFVDSIFIFMLIPYPSFGGNTEPRTAVVQLESPGGEDVSCFHPVLRRQRNRWEYVGVEKFLLALKREAARWLQHVFSSEMVSPKAHRHVADLPTSDVAVSPLRPLPFCRRNT